MTSRSRSFLAVPAVFALSLFLLSCSTPPPPKPAAAPLLPATATPVPPAPTPTPRAYNYPAAATGSVVEDYHGTKVADPYRWMDKADDPATTAWVDAENGLKEKFLNRPERAAIKALLTQFIDYPRVTPPRHLGKFYFFSKNTGLQNQSVYYVQEGLKGEPRAVIDPNTLSADGTVALTNTQPRATASPRLRVVQDGSDRRRFVGNITAAKTTAITSSG
jgi:prolyl oligopeptidase